MFIHFWPWFLPMAAALHIFEEFAWPGGFPNWYRRYRPQWADSMTASFFIKINLIFIGFAFWGSIRAQSGDFEMWLAVSGIQISNAIWHLIGTMKTRSYSPGTVTGLVLYWPLALYGFYFVDTNNLLSPTKMIIYVSLGCCYQLFSNWNHRSRAKSG